MTATGHALIGLAIAAKIQNPFLAIPIAIASHVLADLFPHWDTGTNHKKKTMKRFILESAIDVSFGFLISFILLVLFFPTTSLFYAFVMIIASQLLDWGSAPYVFFKIRTFPFPQLYYFQKNFDNRMDKPWGIINQILIVLAIVTLAILL